MAELSTDAGQPVSTHSDQTQSVPVVRHPGGRSGTVAGRAALPRGGRQTHAARSKRLHGFTVRRQQLSAVRARPSTFSTRQPLRRHGSKIS